MPPATWAMSGTKVYWVVVAACAVAPALACPFVLPAWAAATLGLAATLGGVASWGVRRIWWARPAAPDEPAERAASDAPADAPMQMTARLYHLACALQAQGRREEAAGAYKGALRAAKEPDKVRIEAALLQLASKPPYR